MTLPFALTYTLFSIIVFIVAVVVHELGHLIFLFIYTGKIHHFDIKRFAIKYDEDGLTYWQEFSMLIVPVVMGIFTYLFFVNLVLAQLIGGTIYLICCKSDISRAGRLET